MFALMGRPHSALVSALLPTLGRRDEGEGEGGREGQRACLRL